MRQQPTSTKLVVSCTWDEVPHLSEQAKTTMLNGIPPYQRDARSRGIPQLGSGAIYQVPESDIRVPDMEIPAHWKRAYGMDAGGGAKPTAAVWGAEDPEPKILYLYSVHKKAHPEPVIHATAIKSRGEWINGTGDCAALIMTRHDAEQLIQVYRSLGLRLQLPDKAVETGIEKVWARLSEGRLKVCASCEPWFEEYRFYRRDERGRIVKSNDHLMDATRYLVMMWDVLAGTKPQPVQMGPPNWHHGHDRDAWMSW